MKTANKDIRAAAMLNGVRMWQIAKEMKIAPSALSVRMREELPEEEKKVILDIIEKLSGGDQ